VILVTGATGNVGGELVHLLLDAGRPVRALVRNRGAATLPESVDLALGDLNQPSSLADALKDVQGVFLLGGHRDMPGLVGEIRRARVQRLLLLSSRSVVGGHPDNAIVEMWNVAEDAVRGSGLDWTILRASGFMSNALQWVAQLRAGNLVRAPFANARVAAIDPLDIAAVAMVSLTSDGHTSRHYALSGPTPMVPAEMVAVLGSVLGRDLRFEAQSDAEVSEEMTRTGNPRFADAFFRFFAKGEFDDSPVLPTVQEMIGRSPRTFEQWARAHVHAFR